MTRRMRFTAGTLALLALAFSFAESVWASTCAPMSPVEMVVAEGDSSPGEQERPCPFSSSAAAQLCAGLASLPAGNASLPARSSEGAAEVFTFGLHSGLLLETALFRPPRA